MEERKQTALALRAEKNGLQILSEQPPELVALLLVGFQTMTRKMPEHEIVLWKASLEKYRLCDVRDAMREFVESATREDARGVVLADLLAVIRRRANETHDMVERERKEQEHADLEAARDRGETMTWAEVKQRIAIEHPKLAGLAGKIRTDGDNNQRDGQVVAQSDEARRRRREIMLGQEFVVELEVHARKQFLADKQGAFGWWQAWCERGK